MADPITVLPEISKLIDLGVANIRAEFDGQGDSGEVNEILFYDIDGNEIKFYSQAIENFIYDKIDRMVDSHCGDWVNNDGGYGYLHISVIEKTIEGSYFQRTVEEHTWDSDLFS